MNKIEQKSVPHHLPTQWVTDETDKHFLKIKKKHSKLIIFPVLPKIAPFSPGSDAFFPGDYFSLQCSIIHGDLPIKIFWKFNDNVIETNNEIQTSNMGSRSSVLTIESIRGHHAGNYSCFGQNVAGISNHSVPLIVNGSNNEIFLNFSFC